MAQLFPKWSNKVPKRLLLSVNLLLLAVIFGFWYWGSPKFTQVGYAPVQPIDYSHRLHVSELGIDCQFCHTSVWESARAGIPSTETCMTCHVQIATDSPRLQPLRDSWESGLPVEWVHIHKLAGFAYFNHSAHVNVGVGCATCHGRVDRMEVVMQAEPLSMGWCLDCHNNPAPYLRPVEEVTNMAWQPDENHFEFAQMVISRKNIAPPIYCNACHR